MPYCPLCNKPLQLIPTYFPENFCQCIHTDGVTMRFIFLGGTEATMSAHCKLNQPEREAVPAAFQNAFKDGELQL